MNSKSAGGPWRGKDDGVSGVTIEWTLPGVWVKARVRGEGRGGSDVGGE